MPDHYTPDQLYAYASAKPTRDGMKAMTDEVTRLYSQHRDYRDLYQMLHDKQEEVVVYLKSMLEKMDG